MKTPKPLVRVTQLEAFRRYMEQSENARFEITEQSVIDTISGQFTGNAYTRIGTAFHSVIETGHPKCTRIPSTSRSVRRLNTDGHYEEVTETIPAGRTFQIDGETIALDISQIKTALAYREEHPEAIHELRLYRDYGDAVVTGQLDMIDGLEIHDIKTKYSQPNDEDYIRSCQSHFYMELSGLKTFHYDLFIFRDYNPRRNGQDVRGLQLQRYEPITIYYSPQMATSNRLLLTNFLTWASERGLIKYLLKTSIQ